MSEPLTAAQIIKMIHPDLPPATAHFLLNEAKPLLEFIETQAEERANYKQLATTAIDDAVALRAQLAALQCEGELPELPSPSELNGASNSVMGFTEADLKAYARQAQAMVRMRMVAAPVAPAQPQSVNAHPAVPANYWIQSKAAPVQGATLEFITPLMEQQMFDDWCPYKGNPDPRTVWAAATDAVNGLLLGAAAPQQEQKGGE